MSATTDTIKAIGRVTETSTGVVSSSAAALSPDVWVWPSETDTGHDVADAVSLLAAVRLHRDLRTRTIYLVIDRDNAPLTGNYVVEIDTISSTYDATTDAPADRDALLAAWAAEIEDTLGPEGDQVIGSATVVTWATSAAADSNAIRITGTVTTAANDYSTFSVGASTSAPEAAELAIWKEPDSCKLDVFLQEPDNATATHLSTPGLTAMRTAWYTPARAADIDVPSTGWGDRLDVAGQSRAWLHLHTAVDTDEVLSTVSSGAGIYTVTDLAYCGVSTAKEG